MKKQKTAMGGFTLIELMIVILILAILVAIAIPVFLSARANAQKRTCQANLRTIDGLANAVCMKDDGIYPTTNAFYTTEGVRWVKEVPLCPSEGAQYTWSNATYPGYAECGSLIPDHKYP